jgi:ssDNA-binding Zn-finger/Zn-ribbon topoisomerase 1
VVSCPSCGEDEALRGERVDDGVCVTCETCRAEWTRFPGRTCDRCGGTEVWFGLRALVERSRGTQVSVVGTVDVTMCWSCDREILEDHANRTNNRLLMPDVMPTISGDAQTAVGGELL